MFKIHTIILDLLLPKKCLRCGQNGVSLCQNCLAKITYPEKDWRDIIIAASAYKDETIKQAIWHLKYRNAKVLAKPLSSLLYERTIEDFAELNIFSPLEKFLIIPAPLSKKRFKERGFNQAELLAKEFVAKLTKEIPSGLQKNFLCVTDVLYKIKETPTQVSIKNRAERLKNLKNAFETRNADKINGKNIILIDDVSTTGATMFEIIKVLKKSGAKQIVPIVVARG